jgi:hypothetical protein
VEKAATARSLSSSKKSRLPQQIEDAADEIVL